jgi:hypothetical protein
VSEVPARAAALPAIAAAFETAWASPFPGDAEAAAAAAEELARFDPVDIDDPVNDGDGSYLACVGDLGQYLRGVATPVSDRFHIAIFEVVAAMLDSWFAWSVDRNGGAVDRAVSPYNSAVLPERSTQLRHLEWLETRPLDDALVERIRADSVRRGAEYVEIIEEWWAGPVVA